MKYGGENVSNALKDVYNVVKMRQDNPMPNSYTNYLFEQGLDKILKKCGEELTEVIIAAKNGNNEDTVNEICDLFYHLTVLMVKQEIELEEIFNQLAQRSRKISNLKKSYKVNKES